MDCCQPARRGPGNRSKYWRAVAFSIVIVGAISAAVYSLYPGDLVEATSYVAENTKSATATVPANAEREPIRKKKTTTVYSISDLNRIAADHDFLFVVLPGKDDGARDIKALTVAAATKAEKKESCVGVVELRNDAAEFSVLASFFGVKEFPAVLAMKKDGTAKPILGEITEKRLLQAYLDVCGAGTSCNPGDEKKGCDPKACDPADCD